MALSFGIRVRQALNLGGYCLSVYPPLHTYTQIYARNMDKSQE